MKRKSYWPDREGWMITGSIIVIVMLVVYLIYVVVTQFLPRLHTIRRAYDIDSLADRPFPRIAACERFVPARLPDETSYTNFTW